MTPEYILRKSLCRKAYCSDADLKTREHVIENMDMAREYTEPGYDNPKKWILFNNWNYFSPDVTDLLERYGYSIEWEDEWSTCSDCGRAFRTSPDSYGWQPSYFQTEYDMLCKDCVDMPAYLQTLEDNPRRALNDHIDPSEYGYVKLQGEFENGFHPGQNDNPKDIYTRLHELGHKRLLFNIDSVDQFDMRFSVWEYRGHE